MGEILEDIVEVGCLEVEMLFIEFEYKMFQIECKMINMNPYLSFNEKSKQLESAYLKSKAVL